MKIERVNDHQIRCTLSKKELEKRDLKLSEIAYGNEKVKTLFRDMMRQASFQCGFEAEDIPLMIEVIPFTECAVIIITKVEDPEELDTRFSKFAPSIRDEDSEYYNTFGDDNDSMPEGVEDVLDLFRKLQETRNTAQSSKEDSDSTPSLQTTALYTFGSLNQVTRAARALTAYHGENSLYKNERGGNYVLTFAMSEHTPEEFCFFCNLLGEYATPGKFTPAVAAYMDEHFTPVVLHEALQRLTF